MKSCVVLACLPLLLLVACRYKLDYELLQNHVVAADEAGHVVHPRTGEHLGSEEIAEYIKNVMDCACGDGESPGTAGGVRRLLVYVHGGLNGRETALRTAQTVIHGIHADRQGDKHHPIFLIWPSDGPGSYYEHVMWLRNGRRRTVFGPLTSPIVLGTDVGTGLVRGIGNSAYQFLVDGGLALSVATGKNVLPEWRNADALYEQIEALNAQPGGTKFRVKMGDYWRSRWTHGGRLFMYFLMLPSKLLTSTIVLDGMGRGAWTVMLRRAAGVFHLPQDFDIVDIRKKPELVRRNLQQETRGAMAILMRSLRDYVKDPKNKNISFEITLVGHSMGAIILNHVLLLFGDDLPIKRIVYMAPACSIEDAEVTVVPFLQKNPDARFHLLTLHPLAEVDELNFFDTVPRGSLLEWIDNWYTRPASQTQMRLGKWINVLQALYLFTPCRDQVEVKAFGVHGDSMPQKHGQFNDIPFWRKSVWDPDNSKLYYDRDKQQGLWPVDGS
ncbi:MAG: hypothetical protein ACYS5W_03115 [Planctomycetota bacterium]|jgi:hypothetical protein